MEKKRSRNTAEIKGRRGVLGLIDSITKFFTDAYDSESCELWGRTPERWGLLLAFYICFYIGLAAFYSALWFMWTKVILNTDSPKYSGPVDSLIRTPGMTHIPIIDPERRSTLIRFVRSNDTQVDEITNLMYDSFLEGYAIDNYVSENGNFIECSNDIRNDPDPEKVCQFDLDWIYPCRKEDSYGWGDGQPCIIIKLNRINNWEPENYESIDEVPDEIKDIWQPDYITVKCFGSDPVSRELVGEIDYYPRPGVSFIYYPFTGQQGYKAPIVAAQFMDLPKGVLLFITCKAYSRNMIYSESQSLGMTRFEIISE